MLVLLLACAGAPSAPPPTIERSVAEEPQPTAAHEAWEADALARVPDSARGGPPLHPSQSPLPPFMGVDRGTARYVGSESCASCHPAAWAAWAPSAHAHAVETLRGADRAYDPSCLRCHVTGLGHPGGFDNHEASPGLTAVGCEACHGPGSAHTAAPGSAYGQLPAGGAACVACHSHDNSPSFTWETYWPVVSHGGG